MTTLSEADEQQLQREAYIEKMKGPKGLDAAKHDAHGNYVPLPTTAEEIAWRGAQAQRQEAAKRPRPLPPRVEIDHIEQRRQQIIRDRHHEAMKNRKWV